MTRVVRVALRRSTGYVDEVGDDPAMSEPLDRMHTDTGLVIAYADWTTEGEPSEQHSAWLLSPDGTRERKGVGGPGGHLVHLQFEAKVSGRYRFEIVEGATGDGPVIAVANLDVDVGF